MSIRGLIVFLLLFFCVCFSQADIAPIEPTSKQVFTSNSTDKLGRVPAQVKWKTVPDASYYYLLLSKFENFDEGKLFRTSKPKQHLMLFPNMMYYWQVQAFDKNGGRLPFESYAPHRVEGRFHGVRPLANDLMVSEENSQRNLASDEQPPPQMEQTGKLSTYDYGGPRTGEAGEPKTVRQEMVVRVIESYPSWLQRNKFWVSTEAGLFNFAQSHSVLADVSASGLMFPSFGLNYQTRDFFDHLAAKIYFRNTVGSFETNSTAITMLDDDFQFIQYGLMGQWTLNAGKRFEWVPYLGVDNQANPYFLQISPTSITVKSMDITSAVFGLRMNFSPNSRWRHHLDVAYYRSLRTATKDLSSLDVTGQMIDAQVGMTRQFTKNGFFAGGALRASMRDFTENVVTSTSQASSGTRDTTYYALEFNAGIVF